MHTSEQLSVMKSSLQDGELLDVAGLNKITVLIDRSRTALTEVGINVWRTGIEGPPHFHDAKEQIFYILGGTAEIFVGSDSFRVGPQDLIYIPRSAMHRTVADPGVTITYLLFNAFSDADKEGHGSFADHIDQVKQTRKRQADEAALGSDIDWTRTSVQGIHLPSQVASTASNGQPLAVMPLLRQDKTDRCAAYLIDQEADSSHEILTADDGQAESTIYVIGGEGLFTIDGIQWPVATGDLFYVPQNKIVYSQSAEDGLHLLCLNTIL